MLCLLYPLVNVVLQTTILIRIKLISLLENRLYVAKFIVAIRQLFRRDDWRRKL